MKWDVSLSCYAWQGKVPQGLPLGFPSNTAIQILAFLSLGAFNKPSRHYIDFKPFRLKIPYRCEVNFI